ncbi:hypothetical protein ACSNOK_12365 [Streptomyces sp. URMC 126]|uniref:hypothetical protein n=1 Tax=Streptomyces sp. URMC 126 TaxID=3423401 RepID=UPI003F1AAAD1
MRSILTATALTVAAMAVTSAAQAAELPDASKLGGLTAVDPSGLGETVDGTSQNVSVLAGDAGSRAVKRAVPSAGKTLGRVAKEATRSIGQVTKSH